jgi:hypothetical protein
LNEKTSSNIFCIFLTYLGCEDDESLPYIELQSMSYEVGVFSLSYVVVGYSPPSELNQIKYCVWLRLYKGDDKCESRTLNTSKGDWSVYAKDLDGINYSYLRM